MVKKSEYPGVPQKSFSNLSLKMDHPNGKRQKIPF